jgi:hypothetical protein
MLKKASCFLDDFQALVREMDVRALQLRSQNVILKVVG